PASHPSMEKWPSEGPVPRNVNVSPAHPASRATRSHKVWSVFPTVAAPPGPRGKPGRTSSAGTRVMPGGRAKCAPSRRPSEKISSIEAVILARVTGTTANGTTPALKEWAVIVHALLEGEQIIDVRKGGLREDGRHFDLPARRLWLYPTSEHQRGELLKAAYRHWVDLATAAPVGEPIPIAGWADVVDVATITEAEHLDAIASKLIWTDDYASSRLQW